MSKRIWSDRREEHEKTDHSSHVFEHHHLEGHEIDFDNVEIIDRADSLRKLELGLEIVSIWLSTQASIAIRYGLQSKKF